MRADAAIESPMSSRIRAIRHGSNGILIYFPIPLRGAFATVAFAFIWYVVPKVLAKLAFAGGRNGAQPVDSVVWIAGISVVVGAALVALIANWSRPHLKYNWFCRTSILVEPGRIVIGRIGVLGKFDIAFDKSQNPVARQLVIRTRGVEGAVEIHGSSGSTTFAESCTAEEQLWLVETINAVLKQIPGSETNTNGPEKARDPRRFDPFDIAADSPIVIDENSAEVLRFHVKAHRGLVMSIASVLLVGVAGALLFILFGDGLSGWKDADGQLPTASSIILGVALIISSTPAAVGLWLSWARKSVTLTPDLLISRQHLGPIGRSRLVPVRQIDAITCLAYADREIARQIHDGTKAPDAGQLEGCVVRYGNEHLLLSSDTLVDPVLRSLLRGKLIEWGQPVPEE